MPKIYVIGTRMLEDQLGHFIEELNNEIQQQSITATYLELESEEGARLAELFDVSQDRLPAILILEDDNSVYKDWYGQDLPDAQKVAYELGELTGASES